MKRILLAATLALSALTLSGAAEALFSPKVRW